MAATRTKTKPAAEETPEAEAQPKRWPTIYDMLEDHARAARQEDNRGDYKWQGYTVPGDEPQPHATELITETNQVARQLLRAVDVLAGDVDADLRASNEAAHRRLTAFAAGEPLGAQDAPEAVTPQPPLEPLPKPYGTLLGAAKARVATQDLSGEEDGPAPVTSSPESQEGDGE